MLSTQTLTVRVGCEFRYELPTAVPAIFLVRPAAAFDTRIMHESWVTTPMGPYHDYTDMYGNLCRRVTLPAGYWTLNYEALAVVDGAPDPVGTGAPLHVVEELPDDVLVYTLPSRFCLSDELATDAWTLFGQTTPGWERVQTICDYVHDHITFGYGWSLPTTTSTDVFRAGRGVCRDFAHLAIAFCRAMSIPARYVFGYIPDIDVPPTDAPMDFCAWMEAFIGGRWWTFDPRNNTRRRGRVLIARGRDALDVAMVTTYGTAFLQGMTVIAEERRS
jgi:transglutaminase-like putative cysteine protease